MSISKKSKKYLLLINVISSVVGIVAMIVGYSKVNVTLDASDIFDVSTGSCCMIDKILGAIKRNWYYSESHYCIIASGLFMGLSMASGIGLVIIEMFSEDKEEKRVLSSVNPMYEV
jgi:hypothetical protein